MFLFAVSFVVVVITAVVTIPLAGYDALSQPSTILAAGFVVGGFIGMAGGAIAEAILNSKG